MNLRKFWGTENLQSVKIVPLNKEQSHATDNVCRALAGAAPLILPILPWLSGGQWVSGEVPRQDPVRIDDVPMSFLAQQPSQSPRQRDRPQRLHASDSP